MRTLLPKPRFIQDHHSLRVRQVVPDVRLEGLLGRATGSPDAAQQVREAIRVGFPVACGQLPAILAGHRTEEALDVGHGPPVGLSEAEHGFQTCRHLLQIAGPGLHGGEGQGYG